MAGTRLRGGFDQGWLTFESTGSGEPVLRRLVPIPSDWEGQTDERLELMCRSAEEIVRPVLPRQHAREAESTDHP